MRKASRVARMPCGAIMVLLVACSALSLSGEALAQRSSPETEYQVVGVAPDDVLNLREKPQPTSKLVSSIPANSVGIRSTGKQAIVGKGTWLEITFLGKSGWVNARYVGEVRKDKGRRTAVIVGNSAYKNLPPLSTTRSDAEAISSTLKNLGFEVTLLLDGEYQSTQDALRAQFRALKPQDTIIFYFAGYATHINNKNIILPVDAPEPEAIQPGQVLVLDDIQKAISDTGAKSIFILDACRDVRGGSAVNRGLLRTELYPNMISALSTSPGEVASDGLGTNSPYTRALLRGLSQPNLEATSWVRMASRQAAEETSHLQIPTFTSTLNEHVILSAPQVVLASYSTSTPVPLAENYASVRIFYGTDRKNEGSAAQPSFGADRGHALNVGVATISIPKVHDLGKVETPGFFRTLSLKVTGKSADPNRHFTVVSAGVLSTKEFISAAKETLSADQGVATGAPRFKGHAFVFVHGYATTFESALFRTAQLANDLNFNGLPLLYSWPSAGDSLNPLKYWKDKDSADAALPYMKEFLDLVVRETGAEKVHLISHSMGTRPTMEVLKSYKNDKPGSPMFSQIVLAAPDIDRDVFANLAAAVSGTAKLTTLYASGMDRAMLASRAAADGNVRAGDITDDGASVVTGIDSIDVTKISTDPLALNHSAYAERAAILSDIGALLLTGTRPPDTRTTILRSVKGKWGEYWRFP